MSKKDTVYIVLLVILVAVIVFLLVDRNKEESLVTQENGSSMNSNTSQTPSPSPTPVPSSVADETANWQTYNKYGVSFKYPTDWVLKTDNGVLKNDLNLLLVEKKNANVTGAESGEIPGLHITNAAGTNLSRAKETRVFDVKNSQGTPPQIEIYFKVGTKSYYSVCTTSVVEVCNDVISTFKAN